MEKLKSHGHNNVRIVLVLVETMSLKVLFSTSFYFLSSRQPCICSHLLLSISVSASIFVSIPVSMSTFIFGSTSTFNYKSISASVSISTYLTIPASTSIHTFLYVLSLCTSASLSTSISPSFSLCPHPYTHLSKNLYLFPCTYHYRYIYLYISISMFTSFYVSCACSCGVCSFHNSSEIGQKRCGMQLSRRGWRRQRAARGSEVDQKITTALPRLARVSLMAPITVSSATTNGQRMPSRHTTAHT